MRARRTPTADTPEFPRHARETPGVDVMGLLFNGRTEASGDDGLLARYPGPALLVEHTGRIVAVNLPGAPLANILTAGGAADLGRLISAGIAENATRAQDVVLACGEEEKTIEAVILPVGDGATALVLGRDVTLDRRLRSALSDSRQRYKDLVEIASDFAWETGPDGEFVFVSPRGALGYAPADLAGRPARDVVSERSSTAESEAGPFTTREAVESVQVWAVRQDGSVASLLASALPLYDSQGAWAGARGICRDMTEALAREAALNRANTRDRLLSHILRTVRDEVEPADMLAAAATATARALNADACLVFRGHDAASFKSAASYGAVVGSADVATLLGKAVDKDDPVAQSGWLVAATRYRRAVNGAVALWRAGGERAWSRDDEALLAGVADHLGIAIEQIANHEKLRDLSRTDGLTGLLNRRTFHAELERRWARACRAGSGALIYCDLDNFKQVNDRFGHAAGDDTLRRVAEILGGITRGRDLVARLGGDEFAIWLEDADMPGARRKAESLLAATGALANLTGDADRPFAVSVGIAMPQRSDDGAESIDAFLARADAAMYAAKHSGKRRFAVAEPMPRVKS